MKNVFIKLAAWLAAIILFIKTASTFTLCGGTLIQNRAGFDACTETQAAFMGFSNSFKLKYETLGVLVICIFLFLVILIWRKCFKRKIE